MLPKFDSSVKQAFAIFLSTAVFASVIPNAVSQQSPPQNEKTRTQTPTSVSMPNEQEMERLYKEGKQALDKADFSAAQKAFQAGIDKAEVAKNDKYIAQFWRGMGGVSFGLGQFDKALDYYTRALAIREKLGDPQDIATSLGNLGIVYTRLGQYDKALNYHTRALALFEKLDNPQYIAYSFNDLGTVYYCLGQFDKALDYYTRALAIREKLGDPQGIAIGLGSLGNMYLNLGQYDKALDYYTRALALFEKLDNPQDIARTLHNLGTVYRSLGQYGKALDYYTRALAIREKLGNPQDIAESFNYLGDVYDSLGQYGKALDYYTRALAIREKLGNPQEIADTFGDLGNVYDSLGQFDKALDYYTRALVIREKLGDPQGIAIGLGSLGNMYLNLGQYNKALNYRVRAHALFKKLGNPRDIAQSFNDLGILYFYLNRINEAQVAFDRGIQQFESVSEQVGDPDQIGALQDTLMLYTNYATLRLLLKQPAEALELLERGRAAGLARQLTQSRVDYAAIFTTQDTQRWQDANSERMTAGNLMGAAENNLQRATEQAKQVGIDTNSTPQRKADSAQETEAARKQLDRAKQRDETAERQLSILRNELRQRYAQFAALNQTRPPTAAQLIEFARHNPDTLYLQWAVTEHETLLLALGHKDGIQGFRIPVNSRTLMQRAQTWRNTLQVDNTSLSPSERAELVRQSAGKSEAEQAHALFQTLFSPLQHAGLLAPGRYRRLVMVGDGPLLDMPLAALVTDNGSSKHKSGSVAAIRLLDRYAVSTAVSFGVLTWPQQPNGKGDMPLFCVADTTGKLPERFPASAGENVAQAVPAASQGDSNPPPSSAASPAGGGNNIVRSAASPAAHLPVVGSSLRGGYRPLWEARKEGREIVDMFPGAAGLAGPLAREEAVRAAMAHADILHIAVHNSLVPTSPLRSWLLLAEEPHDSAFDGRLEAREVASMRLKARLAVLSACESGRGQKRGGDGLIGMAWAFRGAGCPCVVASQWKVDDAASHALMTRFYRNLQAGLRKDAAMQRAMQAVRLEKGHEKPFFWAGFEVIGDTTPLFAKNARVARSTANTR